MKGQKLSIREVMIKEHILLRISVSKEMAVQLKEKNPDNLDELGRLADE